MSKVKLIVFEGYGTNYKPYINQNSEVIDLGIEVPDTHSIAGVVRTDFDKESDGSVRTSDDVAPVLAYERINNLVGKLLNQVDAMFADKEQRKAMKEIFTQIAWDWYHGLSDQLTEPWQEDKFPKFKERLEDFKSSDEEKYYKSSKASNN